MVWPLAGRWLIGVGGESMTEDPRLAEALAALGDMVEAFRKTALESKEPSKRREAWERARDEYHRLLGIRGNARAT